jgi:hypothetical protein
MCNHRIGQFSRIHSARNPFASQSTNQMKQIDKPHRVLPIEETEAHLHVKFNIVFAPVWMSAIPISAFLSKRYRLITHGQKSTS